MTRPLHPSWLAPRELLAKREAKRLRKEQRRAWDRANAPRIAKLAEADWNALAHNPDPVSHARQHLAEMDPVRRAQLEAEWNDTAALGRERD